MFRDLKEYQELQKLYEEKVSKPEQVDEFVNLGVKKAVTAAAGATTKTAGAGVKKAIPQRNTGTDTQGTRKQIPQRNTGTDTPPKNTSSFGDAIKANQNRSATTTSTPKMSTSGAQITTNQRQSRDLASKNKDVKLNKFSRTQTYGADAKGVKLVPGAKVGQQVNRSTVFTKADRDITLGGRRIKKGEKLGVLTRNQRRKYDLMVAQGAKQNEPKPDIKPIDANPFQGGPKTDEKKTPAPTENKGKLRRGQGGRPLGDTTRRQGGTVKSGVTLFKKGEDAKKFTDKTGFASKVDTVKGKDPKPESRPMGRSAAKRRKMAASQTNTNTGKVIPKPNTGTDTEGTRKQIPQRNTGTDTEGTRKQIPQRNTGTDTENKTSTSSSSASDRIKAFRDRKRNLQTRAKYGSTATIQTQDGKSFKPGDPGYEEQLKKAKETVRKSLKKEDYEPYDLVLEYLLSTEQVATIEEANYVMTEMDAETIQGIVEEQKKNLDEGLLKAAGIAALAIPVAGAIAKKFLKPKTDKMIDKGRKELNIGGDKRSGVKEGIFADPKLNKKYPNQPKMTKKGKRILPNLPDPEGLGSRKTKKRPRVFGDPTGEMTKDFFN